MANDLSDLDIASPASGDLVSNGDNAIRETREKVKNWATRDVPPGNSNAEHFADGPHRFIMGNGTPPAFPGLPPIGHIGRIVYDTTNGYILRDDGTTWQLVQGRPWRVTAGTTALAASPTVIATLNPVVVPSGGVAMVLYSASVTATVNPNISPSFDLLINGSAAGVVGGQVSHYPLPVINFAYRYSGMMLCTAALVIGNNNFVLRCTAAAGCNANAINFVVWIS